MSKPWRRLLFTLFALPLMGASMNLYANQNTTTEPSDQTAMEKVLERYSRIHMDLVTDSRGQIKDDASLLLVAARKVKDKNLSSAIQDAAKRMISDSTTGMGHPSIPQATQDFKRLSEPIVQWVKVNKPEGWTVVHCSMLQADWVQKKGQEIQNPYAGEDMRSCGEKTS